jgi:hypothetical protein
LSDLAESCFSSSGRFSASSIHRRAVAGESWQLLATQASKLPWPTFFLAAISSAPVSIAQATLVRRQEVICATLSLMARVSSGSFMSAGATTGGIVAGAVIDASPQTSMQPLGPRCTHPSLVGDTSQNG